MKLHKVKSKNAVSYYVIESFRKPNGGGTSSRVVEKLGTAVELKQRLGDEVDIDQKSIVVKLTHLAIIINPTKLISFI